MPSSLGFRASFLMTSIVLAVAFAGCGGSSRVVPQPSALRGVTVDGVARTAMQQQGIPGMTVALAKNGMTLYVKGYGVSDLTTQEATQPGVIFEIGSITKQFTAALIMKLQELREVARRRFDSSLST